MAWTFAARAVDIGESGMLGVVCEGQPIVLCRAGDGYFALLDRCPHQGATLSEGCLVEGFVECPRHFALFDIRTGESGGGVTMSRARTFPARRDGADIVVDLEGDGGITE